MSWNWKSQWLSFNLIGSLKKKKFEIGQLHLFELNLRQIVKEREKYVSFVLNVLWIVHLNNVHTQKPTRKIQHMVRKMV